VYLKSFSIGYTKTIHVLRDNKLHIVPVNIIHRTKDSVFVNKGPVDGDVIITSPVSFAAQGMALKTQEIVE
jgi:hypothetical protein